MLLAMMIESSSMTQATASATMTEMSLEAELASTSQIRSERTLHWQC